jgi:DNA-binding FrmR family transcriptional regulator
MTIPQRAMSLDRDQLDTVVERLESAREQIDGIVTLLEEGRACADVVAGLASVSTALDQAGFGVIALGLRQCVTDPGAQEMDAATMERLFLRLA